MSHRHRNHKQSEPDEESSANPLSFVNRMQRVRELIKQREQKSVELELREAKLHQLENPFFDEWEAYEQSRQEALQAAEPDKTDKKPMIVDFPRVRMYSNSSVTWPLALQNRPYLLLQDAQREEERLRRLQERREQAAALSKQKVDEKSTTESKQVKEEMEEGDAEVDSGKGRRKSKPKENQKEVKPSAKKEKKTKDEGEKKAKEEAVDTKSSTPNLRRQPQATPQSTASKRGKRKAPESEAEKGKNKKGKSNLE